MDPILLLHGALGAQSQLGPLKAVLEKQGRTVYSLDFSGHAGVPFSASGFSIETFAEDIFLFLKRRNIPKADIFGYSMGGYVAVWLAYIYPQKVGRIITLGTKFDWSEASAERETKKLDPEKIAIKVPAFARVLERRHAPNNWKELLHKTSAMMTELGKNPLLSEDILKSIPHKITVCLGDTDDMADRAYSEAVAGLLPHGDFRLLENTPHPIEKVDTDMLQKIVTG
jgi:pimeloyl-ACP methyl ester carboxylesterase